MIVATDRRMSLKEFLTYDDGTDRRYELVDGVLVEMATESTINTLIAIYLIIAFGKMGFLPYQIGIKQKIEVPSQFVTARDPDLIIHTEESFKAIEGRKEACLGREEPNPLLVIEVVSPGTESTDNYQRDYVQKPREYANRGVPEMWQIDPSRGWVRVGTLKGAEYDFKIFTGEDSIISSSFPTLNLTTNQILNAGR